MRRLAIVCLMLVCTVLGAAAASPKQKSEKQEKKELRRQMREEFQRRQTAQFRDGEYRSKFLEKYKNLLVTQSSYMTKATPELLNSVLACYRGIFALVETDEAYGAAAPEAPAAGKRKPGKNGQSRPAPEPYVYDLRVFNISGLHADYGYLLLSGGDEAHHDEALRHLRREMELYPESTQLVETIIANYERHENR